ncbi:MAG TPA: T9SS type A sorting domain-containing protein [Patescibacteria group bacterium]|nr:T9SS type A sorting domain-containing protein [Patescibacteria group bacterium]
MIWDEADGTYNFNEDINKKILNGLSRTWNYTFFQKLDSLYLTFNVIGNSNNLVVAKVNSPEHVDTLPITSGWINSNEFAKAENGHYNSLTDSGSITQLSYNKYAFLPELAGQLSWKVRGSYFYATIDASSEVIINAGVVGISETNQYRDKIHVYPNPATTRATIEFPEQEYSIIEIHSASGKFVTSFKIVEGSNSQTIPLENFPASGQYFLHLKGKSSAVLPVMIYR